MARPHIAHRREHTRRGRRIGDGREETGRPHGRDTHAPRQPRRSCIARAWTRSAQSTRSTYFGPRVAARESWRDFTTAVGPTSDALRPAPYVRRTPYAVERIASLARRAVATSTTTRWTPRQPARISSDVIRRAACILRDGKLLPNLLLIPNETNIH